MEILDYVNSLNKNFKKIIDSDANEIIKITIDDYSIYNTFFVTLQQKLSTDEKKIDHKLNALNYLHMHSTFMFNGFINDIISNNYFSAKIYLRVIIEFYFKYLFLLYSDEYVSELFLDFDAIYMYNLSNKFDNYLKLESANQEQLKNNYESIKKKYDISDNIKEDYWIKIALEHNTGKSNNKSIQNVIQWLKNNNKIEEAIIIAYEDNCDFNHCGVGSLNYQQLIDIYDSQNKYYDMYQPLLSQFNYILFSIIKKFMDEYKEYEDEETIEIIANNLDHIFK